VLDHRFIARHTSGFYEFNAALNKTTWSDIVEQSGVSQELIEQAAQIFIESERTIVCWAMGLTQHRNAVANIQEIVNLLLLRGQIGIPALVCVPYVDIATYRVIEQWESGKDQPLLF
jgi:anaerobic selenocysteine-containing dehydrogenase